MTEGGIAGWRKKEGETFTAGDVLLEIVRIPSTSSTNSRSEGNLSEAPRGTGKSSVEDHKAEMGNQSRGAEGRTMAVGRAEVK
jgi:hypothetical protein